MSLTGQMVDDHVEAIMNYVGANQRVRPKKEVKKIIIFVCIKEADVKLKRR